MTEHDSTRDPVRATAPGDDKARSARRASADPLMQVRAADLEPYTGLGYLSKLFRIIAIFLILLLILEVGTGLYQQGIESLPTLLSEVSRLVVLAGLLWGTGDLATLLIDVGHDVRASRILLGRQVAHATGQRPPERAGHHLADRLGEHPPTEVTAERNDVLPTRDGAR